MNWKRILIFVVVLFFATGLAAFPFGFITGFLQARGHEVPIWVGLGQILTVPLAAIIVFAILGFIQRQKALVHAFVVGLITFAVSYPLNVLLLKQPFVEWAAGLLFIVVTALIGVSFGKLLSIWRKGDTHRNPD